MLDQNTDRMWNVIGAVLIGAGIIFGMNTLMPEAFASIGGMFDDFIGIAIYDPDKEKREEIQDLIDNGFIPVAAGDELDNVRSATVETYGKGTEWEGEYTGGLDKKYIQVQNIDLSEYSEEGWNPIGTYVDWSNIPSFKGTYDGGNHVITGLEVKGEGKAYQGLFGYAQGATISNVGLIDNKVTGSGNYVGGLVGYAIHRSNISNSYATGSVTGAGNTVGGLVGSFSGTIENSYTTGDVTGSERVGGLVGQATYQTDINNSYAMGNVSGGSNAGGLVGLANNTTFISNSYATGSVIGSGDNIGGLVGSTSDRSNIVNSYATGPVTGENNIGGLVGSAGVGPWVTGGAAVENSYATGSVKGTGSYVGGLVGLADDFRNVEIRNSYTTGDVTGEGYVDKFVGNMDDPDKQFFDISNSHFKTTEEMKNQATYEGWDFDTVWMIDGNNYPTLR